MLLTCNFFNKRLLPFLLHFDLDLPQKKINLSSLLASNKAKDRVPRGNKSINSVV